MLKPSDTPWQVVVLARWNRAIFTPKGIARRLFGLKEGESKIQVLIPMDSIAPTRVAYGGLSVIAADDVMLVEPDRSDYGELARAASLLRTAVDALPDTPYTAAGLNLGFRVEAEFEQFARIWNSELDGRLKDVGYELKSRGLNRSVKWLDGEINFAVSQADGKPFELRFNFHRATTVPAQLSAWLQTPPDTIRAEVEKLASSLGCKI